VAEIERVDFEGLARPAVVFRWSGSSIALGVFSVLVLGAVAAFALSSTEPGGPLAGTLLLLMDLALLSSIVTTIRGNRYVALFTEGILQRDPFGSVFVPWNTIERVGYSTWRVRNLGVRTTSPARTSGWFATAMSAFQRRGRRLFGGFDVAYPIDFLQEQTAFVTLVQGCVVDPSARATLGRSSAA